MVEIILEGLNQLLEVRYRYSYVLSHILTAVFCVCKKSECTRGKLCMLIEEASGLDHLEALQNHSSQKIYEMSFNIVEKYFQGEVCLTLIIQVDYFIC